MSEVASQLEEIASRAITLYSRPTVAMELMRLANQPSVEASALKDCVAQDPALTCKVLRVVNSSLYGLHRPVADLGQAIGLIGIKPLKLLVLGFNLPDALFADVAARELKWYWTNTLTRAVAARLIAEQMWRQSGDEPFIAGLLQDIGVLVLLRELGEPYAKFLTGVIEEKCHLASLEQDTLGFDHNQLSAALLSRWQLPERLVEAIAAPKKIARLSRLGSPEGDLPQILHLAEMLMQLAMLVQGLQPQVDQLAESLSLELSEERDYVQILVDANRQMAELGELIAGESAASAGQDHIYNELLAHTTELSDAMRQFLKPEDMSEKEGKRWIGQHAAHDDDKFTREVLPNQFAECKDNSALVRKLLAAATRCRERRQELSLLLAEPNVFDVHSDPQGEVASEQARESLSRACGTFETDELTLVTLGGGRIAAILSNCERRGALSVANHAIVELGKSAGRGNFANFDPRTTLCMGLATASVVPRNFDAGRMIESAMRCLSAARSCGISTVKSIEV
jgi:HD-like signal output (HDOD) protein